MQDDAQGLPVEGGGVAGEQQLGSHGAHRRQEGQQAGRSPGAVVTSSSSSVLLPFLFPFSPPPLPPILSEELGNVE